MNLSIKVKNINVTVFGNIQTDLLRYFSISTNFLFNGYGG